MTASPTARRSPSDEPVALRAELLALQEQRRIDEDEASQLPTLQSAIALTRHDRDACSSPALRAHRAQLERLCAVAEDLVFAIVQTAVLAHLRGDDSDDPVVARARRAIDSSARVLRELSGAEATP
jgi:hypothetical protein